MKSQSRKYLLWVLLIVPLLGGCPGDEDANARLQEPVSGGDGTGGDEDGDNDAADPNSISSIFDQPAEGEAVDPAPDALLADIEATFGQPEDEPREPDEVLGLADE